MEKRRWILSMFNLYSVDDVIYKSFTSKPTITSEVMARKLSEAVRLVKHQN